MPKRYGRSVGPAFSADPGSPADGETYYNTSTGEWKFYSGTLSNWVVMGPQKIRTVHTFSVGGDIVATSGDTGYIPPFFISMITGQSASIVKARYRCNAGTATCKLKKNGADLTGYTSLSVSTTAASTTSTQTVAEDDYIGLEVTEATGCKNLSVTVVLEHTLIS